jgi:hypothetical protein
MTPPKPAKLGEPGALAALIALKLSTHAQFQDKAGGCALVGRAIKRGETVAAAHLSLCAGSQGTE